MLLISSAEVQNQPFPTEAAHIISSTSWALNGNSLYPDFSDNSLLLPRNKNTLFPEREKKHDRFGPLATRIAFQLTYRPLSFFFFFFFCFGVGERELLDSRTRLRKDEKRQRWVLRQTFLDISTSEKQNLKNLKRHSPHTKNGAECLELGRETDTWHWLLGLVYL